VEVPAVPDFELELELEEVLELALGVMCVVELVGTEVEMEAEEEAEIDEDTGTSVEVEMTEPEAEAEEEAKTEEDTGTSVEVELVGIVELPPPIILFGLAGLGGKLVFPASHLAIASASERSPSPGVGNAVIDKSEYSNEV
jgi:hypothetical protein